MEKVTIGISQIMKNELHILPRWFETVSQIADHVTLVDTGSTDGSQDLARELGKKHNIPTDVYDRSFDSFCNSRNFAMQQAKDKTTMSMWIDIDEELQIDPKIFDKQKLDKDIYMFTTYINNTKYTRNELWSNKKDFKWIGPVHEFIVPFDDEVAKTLTSDLCQGLSIKVNFDGNSWKENTDVNKKYKNHAKILEDFIDYEDRDPRWVFYCAQSWHDSATIPNNKKENDERLRRSLKYYQERVSMLGGYYEERYYAQYRVGTIMRILEYPFTAVKEALLKAYNIDNTRGEPIRMIIEHYQVLGEWNLAYLYSKMAVNTFHKMNPYPKRVLFVDEPFYVWKSLELHAISCFYTGRNDEAKTAYNELLVLLKVKPEYFTPDDINKININRDHFLNLK